MTREIADLLPELALGTLPEADRPAVEAALAASPELRRELDGILEALGHLPAEPGLDPPPPPAGVRARLVATLSGPDRFAPFVDGLARIFELDPEQLQRVLARIDDPAGWLQATREVRYLDFPPGPRVATAGGQAGLIRVRAGGTFPRHRHLGPETALVLEGRAIDGGVAYHPGQLVEYAAGTEHLFTAGAERDLVAATLHHGIEPVPVTPR